MFILLVVLSESCKTTKKTATVPQIVKADDGDGNKNQVDTLVRVDDKDKTEVGKEKDGDKQPKPAEDKIFNIALILPLDASSGRIDNNSNLRFIQYYSGIKIAGRDLETNGYSLNVSVFDSKDFVSPDALPLDLDVIIGPYASASSEHSKNELQKIIEYGKKNEIMVISPWYSNSKATENNPYFIQIKPNIREHFNKIIETIYAEGNQSKVVLVGRDNNSDYKLLDYMQSLASAYNKKKDIDKPLDQILVNEKTIYKSDSIFYSKIKSGKSIFVFPNYSYSDEEYLRGILTKLLGEKGIHNITAMGLPILLESEKISYSLYQGLNMELVVPDFVDKDDSRVKDFTRSFYELYKTIPATDAFEGYDLFSFVGNVLVKYGSNFINKLENSGGVYLQTGFEIKPVYPENDDTYSKLQFYENKHLHLLRFRNGAFEIIR